MKGHGADVSPLLELYEKPEPWNQHRPLMHLLPQEFQTDLSKSLLVLGSPTLIEIQNFYFMGHTRYLFPLSKVVGGVGQ